MSDVTRRVSRWKAKFSPDLPAQTTARIFTDMTERYEASMIALSATEGQTKQVLDSSGIDTMYIVFYLNYARQLYKLSRQIRALASLFVLCHFPFPLCAEASRARASRWAPKSCSTNGPPVA